MNIETFHTEARQWLEAHAPELLTSKEDDTLTKAGIIPFIQINEQQHYLLLKPHGCKPGLGEVAWQLCKGTRMGKTGGAWQDVKHSTLHHMDALEPYAITALREGVEELGIILGNVTTLQDMGVMQFQSATSGKVKQMQLFAAAAIDAENMLPMQAIADVTAERQWMTLEDFKSLGRDDHIAMLEKVDALLSCCHPAEGRDPYH